MAQTNITTLNGRSVNTELDALNNPVKVLDSNGAGYILLPGGLILNFVKVTVGNNTAASFTWSYPYTSKISWAFGAPAGVGNFGSGSVSPTLTGGSIYQINTGNNSGTYTVYGLGY